MRKYLYGAMILILITINNLHLSFAQRIDSSLLIGVTTHSTTTYRYSTDAPENTQTIVEIADSTIDLSADTIRKEIYISGNPFGYTNVKTGVRELDPNPEFSFLFPNLPVFMDKNVYLFACSLLDYSNFSRITFKDTVKIICNVFKGTANFEECNFQSDVDLGSNEFYGDVYFWGSRFFSNLSIESSYFRKSARFDEANFKNYQQKNKLTLKGIHGDSLEITFTDAILPDTIDLSYVKGLYKPIDFTSCNFSNLKDQEYSMSDKFYKYFLPRNYDNNNSFVYINLYNSDIVSIKMDYLNFRLYFPERLPKDQIISIYETLLKHFRDNGQLESAKKLDIEYQYFIRDNGIWAYVADWWWRFGYEKDRVFAHIITFIVLFSIITYIFIGYLHEKVYPLEAINYQNRQGARIKIDHLLEFFSWNRFWFSFVYTTTLFFAFSIKIDRLKFKPTLKNIVAMLYVLLICSLGLICIGYVANFILQKDV